MTSWLWEFPEGALIDIGTPINEFVMYLSKNFGFTFDLIKTVLLGFTQGIQFVVESIPWWIVIIAVGLWGYKASGRPARGFLFSSLLLFVGLMGL